MAPGTAMRDDDRPVFWPKVIGRIMEHPLTGAGFGRGVMNKAYPDLIPRENRQLWHAHNVVLDYGLAMGIPGMLVLLMVFGALLREYVRLWQSEDQGLKMIGACGMVLVLGVFARNMVNDMFVRDAALLFWALNGMLLGFGRRKLAAARGAV
jgi:O-antigen ligase